MAQIIQRVTNVETMTNLELTASGETVGRQFSFGSNWTWLRIGFRFRVATIGGEVSTSTTTTPTSFSFGICAGTSSMVNSPNCPNYIGWHWYNKSLTWRYYSAGDQGNLPVWVQHGGSPFGILRQISGSYLTTGTNTYGVCTTSATGSLMGYVVFEVEKRSPLWQTRVSAGSGLNNPSWTLNTLYDGVDFGVSYTGKGSVLMNESSGSLDTFCIQWKNPNSRNLEIADVLIARVE